MKIKVVALALAFTGSAFASEQGFYLGGKVGYDSINSKMELDTLTIDSVGNQGASYGVFAGYNFPIHQTMYLGLEAEYFKHTTEAKFKLGSLEETVEFQNEYGASLILGHSFSDNVNIYGRAGMSKMKSEGKVSTGEKGDDSVTGWHGGLGVEFKNNSPMSLRAEYRFTQYKEINYDYGADTDTKPKSQSFTLSVIYSF